MKTNAATAKAAPHHYLDPETVQKIGSLSLVAHRAIEGLRTGSHRSVLRGFSTEFAHHRPYTLGDAIRHVDWRVYGRSERYYTKLYEAETNFEAHLLLDASSSMRYGSGPLSKLEYAKYLAATLAHLVIEQRDSVGLAVYDSKLRGSVPPSGSRTVVARIDELLHQTRPEPRTDLGALLDEFARRITRRGFVLLFSDLFDEPDKIAKGLDHLRFRGQNVIVFHTLDKDELSFPFDGTCRFVGLEGEAELITQPKRIHEAYRKEVERFTSELRDTCVRRGVEYVMVDTSRPLDLVLHDFLLSRTAERR